MDNQVQDLSKAAMPPVKQHKRKARKSSTLVHESGAASDSAGQSSAPQGTPKPRTHPKHNITNSPRTNPRTQTGPATPLKEGLWAGPAFHSSPDPSSLPIPRFFRQPNTTSTPPPTGQQLDDDEGPASPSRKPTGPAPKTNLLGQLFAADRKERNTSLDTSYDEQAVAAEVMAAISSAFANLTPLPQLTFDERKAQRHEDWLVWSLGIVPGREDDDSDAEELLKSSDAHKAASGREEFFARRLAFQSDDSDSKAIKSTDEELSSVSAASHVSTPITTPILTPPTSPSSTCTSPVATSDCEHLTLDPSDTTPSSTLSALATSFMPPSTLSAAATSFTPPPTLSALATSTTPQPALSASAAPFTSLPTLSAAAASFEPTPTLSAQVTTFSPEAASIETSPATLSAQTTTLSPSPELSPPATPSTLAPTKTSSYTADIKPYEDFFASRLAYKADETTSSQAYSPPQKRASTSPTWRDNKTASPMRPLSPEKWTRNGSPQQRDNWTTSNDRYGASSSLGSPKRSQTFEWPDRK